jgi:hypothetical protein
MMNRGSKLMMGTAAVVTASVFAISAPAYAVPMSPSGDGAAVRQLAAASPAATATQKAGLSAAVTAIVHDAGRVRLVGTAPPGASVFVGGQVVAPVAVRAGDDGAWTATALVESGERTIRVSNDANRKKVDVAVEVLHLISPTVSLERNANTWALRVAFSGHPKARFLLFIDGVKVAETRANDQGKAWYEVAGIDPGEHLVRMEQRFDGALNGGWQDRYEL